VQVGAAKPLIEVPETFEVWYLRERPRLVAALTALCGGNRVEAAEIADETCARTLARWDRVQRMESPGGWAYRVALNVLRRRARRARQEMQALRAAVVAPDAVRADWSLETREAIAALPVAERTTVVLRLCRRSHPGRHRACDARLTRNRRILVAHRPYEARASPRGTYRLIEGRTWSWMTCV
jgi:DNA-directed RNA polymerase specialized sigma24 family protein